MNAFDGSRRPGGAGGAEGGEHSYAPYTFDYAGMALKTGTRHLHRLVAEDAAFNPSMSPLEAAVVSLVISGGKSYSDIVDAVLVEMEG